MKFILVVFSLLSTPAFSQTELVRPGERYNGNYLVTAIDSNEVYIWVGTTQGLFRINRKNNRRKYYSLSNTGYSRNYVTGLLCAKDGMVWIGTNNGLLKYDNYGFIPFTTENSNLPENFITSVSVTAGDELLVSTAHYGFMRMQRNRFHPERGVVKLESRTEYTAPLSVND